MSGPPVLTAMVNWLGADQVLLADGSVLSWYNPAHPGYAYPEAAGLWLALFARDRGSHISRCERIVRRLVKDVAPSGGVGRRSHQYLFDTAIVLGGLLAYKRAGGTLPANDLPNRLFNFIVERVMLRQATLTPVRGDRVRWSLSYACHLLKVTLAVEAYLDQVTDARGAIVIDRLVTDLIPLYTEGRFRIHADSHLSYLHASCYAVEGLIALRERGRADVDHIIEACAHWLAKIQQPNGGFPAWYNGISFSGACHADIAAQAIRIWAYVERECYTTHIERALAFLGELQAPAGGIRYHAASEDVNTWATIFAVQAVHWVYHGSDGRWIV